MNYSEFLKAKEFKNVLAGFKPVWIPDFLFDFQKELVEWAIRRGRSALFEDCLGWESVINSPYGDITIGKAFVERKPITVYALDHGRVIEAVSTIPFIAGVSKLYRFSFSSGREVVATLGHHCLSPQGWKAFGSCEIGQRLLVCDVYRPPSNSGYAQLTHDEDGQNYEKKCVDSPTRYSPYCHLCDEPPRSDSDICLNDLPLRDDALLRIQQTWHKDGPDCIRKYIRHHLDNVPLSTAHSACLVGTIAEDVEYQLPSSAPSYSHGNIQTVLPIAGDTIPSQRACGFSPLEERPFVAYLSEPYRTSLFWDTLSAVDYIRTDMYFDIKIPRYENFLVNGIWSHNCGLGKTPQQLVWAENVVRKTNKRILIVTPLSVSHQTLREAEKFRIKVKRSPNGQAHKGITVTNYERLDKFNPKDFQGIVCDESSILKHQDAKTRKLVTEFVRTLPYRLLCTATPAPNDFMELGTSAEALGTMTYNQMLAMFFTHIGDTTSQWTLKAHAKRRFWEWMSTWARAIRRPSDLRYPDKAFKLPPLAYERHILKSPLMKGSLIVRPAVTMDEQRAERRSSLQVRCEEVARIVAEKPKEPWVVWCHLNPEGDLLEKIIPNSRQVSGSMSDEEKEERFMGFVDGDFPVLITKPKIGGFGMNWQHCPNMAYFPDDSYEKFYQCMRRCWRFGQKRKVTGHIVSTERQSRIVKNMMRKERQADEMYNGIIRGMRFYQLGKKPQNDNKNQKVKVPSWL